MEYKRFGSTVVARIDRGEEVLSALKDIALRENIKLAAVSALGATDDFTVGVFNVQQKQYHANRFQGAYEIVSLTGTVTTKDGEFYAHLHMCAGNEQRRASEPGRYQRHLRNGHSDHRRHRGAPLQRGCGAESLPVLTACRGGFFRYTVDFLPAK